MPSAKRNVVTKTASRPCKPVGPPNATMVASTISTRGIKKNSNCRITKSRSPKSSYRYAFRYENMDDEDGDDEDEDDRFSNQSQSPDDYFDSDGEFNIAEDTDDDYTGGSNIKINGAGNTKPKVTSKKDSTRPDPNGRVKGRDLIPWTSKSNAAPTL